MVKRQPKGVIIAIAVSTIIAVALTLLSFWCGPNFLQSFNSRPSEDDYDLLRNFAVTLAITGEKEVIEDLDISTTEVLTENSLTINVKTYKCKVEATYPVSITLAGEGRTIIDVHYKKGTYETKSQFISNILSSFGIYIITIGFYSFAAVLIISEIKSYLIKKQRK